MNIKKTFMLALPLLGLAATGLAALSNSNKAVSKADAADYSTSANGFELNAQDNSVSATFTVTNSTLSMRGWLLCLLTEKPAYDVNTRKLNGSNDLHPYTYNNCVHYFSSSYTGNSEGEMSITWVAKSADQKSSWGTDIDEENNLAKYMADENNYYIVIGPRHYDDQWGTDGKEIGNGKDGYWENCDYYVGSKNSLLHGLEGQTYLDIHQYPAWADNEAKFAFRYTAGSGANEKVGWSEFATSQGNDIYLAQYSLSFVPEYCEAYRLDSTATEPNGEDKLNTGYKREFHEYSVVTISGLENSSNEYELAAVKYQDDSKAYLDHFKRDESNNYIHYNSGVHLDKGDKIVISYYTSNYHDFIDYTAHSHLVDNFKVTDGKIEVLESGIYALYFNAQTSKLYISSSVYEEVDEWCTYFLGENCSDTKTRWDNAHDRYVYNLSSQAADILETEKHVAHDANVTNVIAQAMQRYDFLVANFVGYNDYIGRSSLFNSGLAQIESSSSISNNSVSMIIVIASAMISVIGFSSLLIIKRRKNIK